MSTLSTTNLKNPSSGSNNIVLAADGSTTIATLSSTTITGTTIQGTIKQGTSVASTSGTSIDFTGIPSWVKRITVMLGGVSTNGTSNLLLQIGDSGGIETTGYLGASTLHAPGSGYSNFTTGYGVFINQAAQTVSGAVTIFASGSNLWIASGAFGLDNIAAAGITGGQKTLSDTLTQVRITTVNGTDTFDAGTINILMEG